MTPVMYLSDAFLGNGAEPWRVPSVDDLPDISVPNAVKGEGTFLPVRPRPRDPVAARGPSPARPASSTASAASRSSTASAPSATTPTTTTG